MPSSSSRRVRSSGAVYRSGPLARGSPKSGVPSARQAIGRGDANHIDMAGVSFASPATFNVAGMGVILILIALDATWW